MSGNQLPINAARRADTIAPVFERDQRATAPSAECWLDLPAPPLDLNGPTAVPYAPFDPSDAEYPIFDLFRNLVEQSPERIAVADSVRQLSRRQVWNGACRLAHIIATKTGIGRPVGILLPNDAYYPVAVLGCLAAARPCLVLDRYYPAERNLAIIRDAGLAAIVVEASDLDDEALYPREIAAIAVDPSIDRHSSLMSPPDGALAADDPAVIVYTSGSTGEPKGIVLSQRAILHRAGQLIDSVHLGAADRSLPLGSPCTIAGIQQVLEALLAGALLVKLDLQRVGFGAVLDTIRDRRVTVLFATPSLLRSLVQLDGAADRLSCLRCVHPSGEVLLGADLDVLGHCLPASCGILVVYGLTEAPAICQWFVPRGVGEEERARVAVGYRLPGYDCAVLDQDGRPLGSEETGELVVRSRYTALGEWQGGRLVAGRLRPDPADPLRRTLRTGDLVRVRTDGVVVVVSRKDRQIQIHGMRIEPYEIECALRSSPSVINAAVVPCETEGETSLTAFVVLAEPCDMDAIRELKKHLARSMPSHMRPSRIIPLERLPLLPGYKVDIEALRALGMSPERPSLPFGQDWSPVDGMGKTLEQAWCRIFGRDSWERDATFADVGGDSLDLLSLVFAVERQLDIALPLANFDLDMTVGDMARVVTAVLDEDVIAPSRHEGSSVVLLKCGTGQPPVFITPGLSGHGGEVREIGKFLASDRPVFALQAPGLNGGAVLTEIEAFAAQYTATIEKIQPRGPYVLIGNSLGGFIALEVARILRGRGERIALTALLESYPHPRFWPISVWLNVLLGLARHHLYTIRRLPPGQIVPYTAIRAANLINHLAARLLRVLQPFDVGAGSARLRKVRRGLIAAWARYRPSRYDGDIVFFKPQTTVPGLPREPLSVWWKFVGQMEVITVPGDHDTMRGAHADALAAALDRCIERALAKG